MTRVRKVTVSADVLATMATDVIPETHRDLLASETGILATIGPDGRPQLSAVWFVAEANTIKISVNTSRKKVRNLRANPAVGFFILDPHAPTRYLEIRGDAEITDDPDYRFADQVGQKYRTDLRAFDGDNPQRVIVSIHPTRVNAVDMLA